MKKMSTILFVSLSTICYAQQQTLIVPDGHSSSISSNIKSDLQGKYIYTAETNRCIMWETKTGKQLYSFMLDNAAYGDGYIAIDISPDGSKIAIASGGFSFLYNTKTGKKVAENSRNYSYYDLKFSADGNSIYAINNGIHILDATTFTEKELIKDDLAGYGARIWLLADDKVLAGGTDILGTRFKIYDIKIKQKVSSFDMPASMKYWQFLPGSNLVSFYNYDIGTGILLYDIYTGAKKGTIPFNGDVSQARIIPSQNSNEILISAVTGLKDNTKNSSLNLYNTTTFQKTDFFKDVNFNYKDGYFDGAKKKIWIMTDTKEVAEYDFTLKKYIVSLKGLSTEISSSFYTILYNNANGYLHLTDVENFKTIDLAHMKPLLHRDLKIYPDAVAVSFTGDTIAVFNNDMVTIKNIVTGTVIKTFSKLDMSEGINHGDFFFSNDGKFLFYTVGSSIIKMNLSSGIKQSLVKIKGSGITVINPDKTMIAGFEIDYKVSNAFVWDLATNKEVFSKPVPQSFIQISYDKKSVLLQEGDSLNKYDIEGKKLLNTVTLADNAPYTIQTVNKDVSLLARGYYSGAISMYDGKTGKQLYTMQAHVKNMDKIFFSPDEKTFYSIAEFDNSIKAWETATGRLIGTLYLFKGSNDYVFMDADGRFDGTPEGVKQIYYVINQKPMPLDRLFEKYFTPNLYARSVAGEKFDKIDVVIKSFPKAKVSYAEAKRNLNVEEDGIPVYKNTTGFADITVNASAEDDAIDEIRLFQNGKIVTLTNRNLIIADNADKTDFKKYRVALLPGENNIRAIALNTQRSESEPDEIIVNYNDGGANIVAPVPVNNNKNAPISTVDKTATMYLVVIGINKYQNEKLSLNYALADATAFKDEIEKDAKTVLGNVKTFFVTDNTADKKGITDALTEVQKNAKPQDVFVFYYAGHGYISEKTKEFYLVPTDVADIKNVDEELLQKGIPSKMLQTYAIDIQAQKQIFILDACQSAGAFQALLTNDANQQKSLAVVSRSTGTHWLAASGSQQFAQEFATLKHGAFTYVLLQALQGQAAANKMITVNGLKAFMQVQVPELMKKYNSSPQYPASYGLGNDFPVELIR